MPKYSVAFARNLVFFLVLSILRKFSAIYVLFYTLFGNGVFKPAVLVGVVKVLSKFLLDTPKCLNHFEKDYAPESSLLKKSKIP